MCAGEAKLQSERKTHPVTGLLSTSERLLACIAESWICRSRPTSARRLDSVRERESLSRSIEAPPLDAKRSFQYPNRPSETAQGAIKGSVDGERRGSCSEEERARSRTGVYSTPYMAKSVLEL
jgi:hypothetical protein